MTTVQSKYFIYIFTHIVGQKNYFQFSSRVYLRINEVWNMILWNIIPTYHFNMRTSKQCMKYLEPSELSLHKDALSLELSFNSSMQKLVQCGWFLNLYILFLVIPNNIYKKLGTFDVLLIPTIFCKK